MFWTFGIGVWKNWRAMAEDFALQIEPDPEPRFGKELAALSSDWIERYGGEPSRGMLGKYLRPLLLECCFTQVQNHWRHYLKQTPPRFASVAKFAQTFAAWAQPIKNPPLLPYKPSSKFVYDCAPGELRGRAIQVAIDDPRPAL